MRLFVPLSRSAAGLAVTLALCLSACAPPAASDNASGDASADTNGPVAADCGADGKAIGVSATLREVTPIREKPDEKLPAKTVQIGPSDSGVKIEAVADHTVQLIEVCQRNGWSLIRNIETRNMFGWVPTHAIKAVKTDNNGRRIYAAADFDWPSGTRRYRAQIVTIANRVMRQDARCEAIQLNSLLLTDAATGGLKMLCNGPAGSHDIDFVAADAQSGRSFAHEAESAVAEPVEIGMADARAACQPEIERRLSHPASVNYDFGGATIHTDGSNTQWTTTGTAENSFGGKMPFIAKCYFHEGIMTSVEVSQN